MKATTEKSETYIVLYESVWHSFWNDAISVGWLIALIWANATWGNSNWHVNAFGAFLALTMLLKLCKLDKVHRFTREELRGWALSESE